MQIGEKIKIQQLHAATFQNPTKIFRSKPSESIEELGIGDHRLMQQLLAH